MACETSNTETLYHVMLHNILPTMSFVLDNDVVGRSRSEIFVETSLTAHDTDGKFPVRMEVPHKKGKVRPPTSHEGTGVGVEV